MRCRGNAFSCCFLVIPSARHHHQFIIPTTDQDAFTNFFHHHSGQLACTGMNQTTAMHDPPRSADIYHQVLHASSTTRRVATNLQCHLFGLIKTTTCGRHRQGHSHSSAFVHGGTCHCIYIAVACALATMLRLQCDTYPHPVFLKLSPNFSNSDIRRYRRHCT